MWLLSCPLPVPMGAAGSALLRGWLFDEKEAPKGGCHCTSPSALSGQQRGVVAMGFLLREGKGNENLPAAGVCSVSCCRAGFEEPIPICG